MIINFLSVKNILGMEQHLLPYSMIDLSVFLSYTYWVKVDIRVIKLYSHTKPVHFVLTVNS